MAIQQLIETVTERLHWDTLAWLFDLAFIQDSKISQVIISLIAIITGLILLRAGIGIIQIAIATFKLIRFKRRLYRDPDKSWSPAELDPLSTRKTAGSWMSRKIEIVRSLREDVTAAVDDFNNIDAGIAWRMHGILRFPIGTLVIFGLLGTVWGLQDSIYSLLPTMQNELDLEQLQGVMAGTLAGMQTAFSTTLAGLICSVLAGFLVMVFLKAILGKLLQAQNRLLVNKIVPIYSLLGTERLSTLVEQNKELKNSVRDISAQSELLFQPIVDAATGLKASVGQFGAAAKTMDTVGKSMGELGASIESGLGRLSTSLKGASTTLERVAATQDRIEDSVSKFNDLPSYFETLLESLESKFDKAQREQADSYQQIIGEKLEKIESILSATQTMVQSQRDEETNLVTQLTKATSETISRMESGVSELNEKLSATINQIETVTISLRESMEQLLAGQERINESHLESFKGKMSQVQTGLSGLLEQARRDEENRNHQLVNALTEWVAYNQYLSKMLSNLDELPIRLGDQVAEQQAAVSSLASQLSSLPKAITESLKAQAANSKTEPLGEA